MPKTGCTLLLLGLAVMLVTEVQARVVFRCVRDRTVSLATAPEPGSKCTAQTIDDNAARLPNLWGVNGTQKGTLYERQQDGITVYSTRNLPGSTPLLSFMVTPPPDAPAHAGPGRIGEPRTEEHAEIFREAARANKIEDAWLRAIAHAESNFQADAISPTGAQGIMQLLPSTSVRYKVKDPFSPAQSIRGGAKYLGELLRRFKGNHRLATAAYNAGEGAVSRYNGVPPYAEAYVAKVDALYASYSDALGIAKPRHVARKTD